MEDDPGSQSEEQRPGGGRNDEELERKAAEKAAATGGVSEYKVFVAEAEATTEFPNRLERSEIHPGHILPGGTEIILQRHGQYVRNRDDPNVGKLADPEAETAAATEYFKQLLDSIPPEERDKVDIMFLASDTQYFEGGHRSYQTAALAQEAASDVLEAYGLSRDQIVNRTGSLHTSMKAEDGRMPSTMGPKTMPNLREPSFISAPNPNGGESYFDFLLQKANGEMDQKFWKLYEEDVYKDERLKRGAEGPDDIADRTGFTVNVLARYARQYHADPANEGRRLIIWGGTHYDTISPFVKRDVFEVGKEQQLLVDYGAGMTIDISPEGEATTTLGGKEYAVPLNVQKQREKIDVRPPLEQSQT